MIKPFKLGYAEFNCLDVERIENYYSNVMGMTVTDKTKDTAYISSGTDHHTVVLKHSNESSLDVIGYQIERNAELKDVVKILGEKGISAEVRTDARPGVHQLVELQDPDGFTLQLFHEIETPAPGYKENGISPFKLGHIAIGSMDAKKSTDFYMNVLNFSYTDTIGTRASFLTCNTDHHVLNVSSFGHKMMHHIAFELKDTSHHVRAADILAKNEMPIVWGPSRHTAGHNMATYHHDPELNLVELYIDMDQYIKPLGHFDPRPWHEELPLRPRIWEDNCAWYTKYETTILDAVLKKTELQPI
ncbi:hypothetical protein AV656_08180 [Bhargavaea cecembensis]|uniref:VOC domain-containing protein n=1 Tax=Bhargavaea cecembensis TaxID=394098 RepID=A0A165H5W9_9BACL|nr:VOC family protein [Bhargavaea cecembensis]KZE38869.1 hypothetical protein AV656_08180 [Bhargavaea cecembensis]